LHHYPPADFLDYVNAPIGEAMPIQAPGADCIPTTAGTGARRPASAFSI
jgi:hypothetical protein